MKEPTNEEERQDLIDKVLDRNDFDIDRKELEMSAIETRECQVCEDELYRFIDIDSVSCPICGWDQLVVNSWGEQEHMEHMTPDTYIDLSREDAGEGQVMCMGCYENFSTHPDGTIVIHRPDREDYKTSYMGTVIQGRAFTDYSNGYDDLPKELKAVVQSIVTGTEYHSVDAWRGQNVPPSKPDGFTEVMSGWHSTMEKTEASKTINALDQLSEDLQVPIIKVLNQGSNVCSIGISLYAMEDDYKEVKEHIEEAGTTTGMKGHMYT